MSHGGQGFSFPGLLAGRRLSADDAERLIAGHWAHPEAPAEQHVLAALFDSATAPPTDRERAGEAAAVAAFMLAAGDPVSAPARPRGRPVRRAWIVVTAAIAAALVTGFSGAAVAGALPGPVQELAHRTFGAPAPGQTGPPAPALVTRPAPGRLASLPATEAPSPQRPAREPGPSATSTPAPAATSAPAATPMPAATSAPAATETAKDNGNGNGQGNGNGNGQGNGKGNGKGNGQGNGKGNGKGNGNGNGKKNGNG
jgi:hypothetical protein